VQSLGSATSTTRTAEQTEIGKFRKSRSPTTATCRPRRDYSRLSTSASPTLRSPSTTRSTHISCGGP
jgi:hypothetical protein